MGGFKMGGFNTYEATDTPESFQKFKLNKDLTKEYNYDEVWEAIFKSPTSPLPNKLTSDHRIVIVDADALVYRVSAACEERSVVATVGGWQVTFKNKTALKKFCVLIGVDFEGVEYEDVVVVDDLYKCFGTIKRTIRNLFRVINASHILFFLGGSHNFRNDLPLPVKYKSNRKTTRRPQHLPDAREYLMKYYDTFTVTGIEADDVVQGATEYIINKTEAYAIAYNLDKDFHTSMTKNRYWHITKSEIVELSGGLGELYLSGNTVKGDGLMWVCYQLLLGDVSDGYSPKTFFNKRYGEKSFYRDFKDCKTENELLTAWIAKWKSLLPESIEYEDWEGIDRKHNWLSLAELYFQCLYMRMSPVDHTTFEDILTKYGAFGEEYADISVPKEVIYVPEVIEDVEVVEDWEW